MHGERGVARRLRATTGLAKAMVTCSFGRASARITRCVGMSIVSQPWASFVEFPRSLGTLWCVLTQAPVPTTEHVPLLTIKPQPHKRATAVAAAAVEDGGSGSAANTYSGKAIRHEREMRKQAAVTHEALAKDRPATRDGAAAFDPAAAGVSDAAVDEYLQCIHTAFAKGTQCSAVPWPHGRGYTKGGIGADRSVCHPTAQLRLCDNATAPHSPTCECRTEQCRQPWCVCTTV